MSSLAVEGEDGSDCEETVFVKLVGSERVKVGVEQTSTGNDDLGVGCRTYAHHRHVLVSVDLPAQITAVQYRT